MVAEIRKEEIKHTLNCPLGTCTIPVRDKDKNQIIFNLYTTKSPHNNCQTWNIASFYMLLYYGIENIHDVLRIINAHCSAGKLQLLLDINQKYISQIEKLFDKDIIFKQNYTSTNNSNMCIILTKTSKIG